MNKIFAIATLALAASTTQADVGGLAGMTYAFGANGGIGFSLMATSDRDEDSGIGNVGISYYPFAKGPRFGIPIGAGYQWQNAAGTVTFDLLQQTFGISAGYTDTREDGSPAPVPVLEVPPQL